ncbi:hypothetical protein Tco_0796844 [Tanacetum coccineum]
MKNNPQLQHDDLPIWLALKIKFEGLYVSSIACRSSAVRPRDQDDPRDDAHPGGENSAKRQKTSEHGTYVFGESSSSQANESEPSLSTSDDDELPAEKVSQELVEEMLKIVDEAKLLKVVTEMMRQRCTSGDEHQYHIDQMQNFLKNDIVWESRKEILSSPYPQKPTPVVQSSQRDPKVPALSLVNQDLLYLKKGNLISKNFEHWKNPHAKIYYIKRQKEPGKPIEEVYSNSKIVQPDYKNLNKNDIEDMYLLCVDGKVDDYAKTGLLWSLSVLIRRTNSKKEKRVMGHHEIHKFCDATLKRVLEGLKSYNNDVKHGYVKPSLSNDDAEYLLRKKLKNS